MSRGLLFIVSLRALVWWCLIQPAAPVVVAGRELVKGPEAWDLGLVRGDDPAVGRAGVLSSGDPAASQPGEQCRHLHPDLTGEGRQPPFVRSQMPVTGVPVGVQARSDAEPADQVLDFAGVEALVQAGRAPSFAAPPGGGRPDR